MKTRTMIWVTTQFEAIHAWPDAPDEVDFLRNPHRHMFHVKVTKSVTHDDRDIEFITLKRLVDDFLYLQPTELGASSCEMIARVLLERFDAESVEVSEDGENGARIERID